MSYTQYLEDAVNSQRLVLKSNNERIAKLEALVSERDAMLGKRPCQNSRCNELSAARALLREVQENGVWSSDSGENYDEALELEARIDSYLDACDTPEGKC